MKKRLGTVCQYVCMLILAVSGRVWAQQSMEDIKRAIERQKYHRAASISNQMLEDQQRDEWLYYYNGFANYQLALQEGLTSDQEQRFLQRARERFEEGVKRKRKSAINRMGVGMVALVQGEMEVAKSAFDEALELEEKNIFILNTMATAYLNVHQDRNASIDDRKFAIDQATKLLTRARTLDENNPQVYITLGDVYVQRGVELLPETNYKKAIQLAPNSVEAHYALGKYYLEQEPDRETPEQRGERLTKARDELVKVTELDPKFAPAYKLLTELYFNIQKYKFAKEYAEKYVQLLGNDLPARIRYAQLLYLIQEYEDAIGEFETILKDTTTFVILRIYGYSLHEQGNHAKAADLMNRFFQQVEQENIISKDYRYNALIHLHMGDSAQAEQNLKKFLELEPEAVDIYKEFHDYYYDPKKPENYAAAAYYLDKYLEEKPDVNLRLRIAWLYSRLEAWEKAIGAYDKVVENYPQVISAHLKLATIKSRLDTTNQGLAKPHYIDVIRQVFEQGKQDDPKHKGYLATAYGYLSFYYYDEGPNKNWPKSLAYSNRLMELGLDKEKYEAYLERTQKIIDFLKGNNVEPAELDVANPDGEDGAEQTDPSGQ